MSTVAIIQARMNSTRLPGKVLRPLVGRPMLWHIFRRLGQASRIDKIVVATSSSLSDKAIRRYCRSQGIAVFAGPEKDVLDRFYQAARSFQASRVVRITGDCPLTDPAVVDQVIEMVQEEGYDFAGVATGAGAVFLKEGRFPDGLDAECFSFQSLETAWSESTSPSDREHVTPYIWQNNDRFRVGMLTADRDYGQYRWTVDTEADLQLVRKIYSGLYPENSFFSMQDVLEFLQEHPELAKSNQKLVGREGYQEVWRSAS